MLGGILFLIIIEMKSQVFPHFPTWRWNCVKATTFHFFHSLCLLCLSEREKLSFFPTHSLKNITLYRGGERSQKLEAEKIVYFLYCCVIFVVISPQVYCIFQTLLFVTMSEDGEVRDGNHWCGFFCVRRHVEWVCTRCRSEKKTCKKTHKKVLTNYFHYR